MVVFLKDLVGSRSEQRALPEFGIFVAEEEFLEHDTGKECTDAEDQQRNEHDGWRFMDVMHDFRRSARLAVEGHENQTP